MDQADWRALQVMLPTPEIGEPTSNTLSRIIVISGVRRHRKVNRKPEGPDQQKGQTGVSFCRPVCILEHFGGVTWLNGSCGLRG